MEDASVKSVTINTGKHLYENSHIFSLSAAQNLVLIIFVTCSRVKTPFKVPYSFYNWWHREIK